MATGAGGSLRADGGMAQVLGHSPRRLEPGFPTRVEIGEAAARRALRAQVARLERELADCLAGAGTEPLDLAVPSAGGPRLLGIGELEVLRDGLASRLRAARAELARRADRQERSRLLLEEMLRDPRAHKYVRVTNADLGEPGCTSYHVRPRLGLIGMLMGWWRVTLSSGCP